MLKPFLSFMEKSMAKKTKKGVSRAASFITKFVVPVVIIAMCVHFLGGVIVRNSINNTIDDIVDITRKIAEDSQGGKYRLFNTDSIALGEYLPYDLKAEADGEHFMISNRFGGQMHFLEAVGNKKERTLYFGLYNNPERYHQVYDGVSAYVILLTNLNSGICKTLAQTDWSAKIPNFMGIEAAYTTPTSQNNGVYNLSNYILTDNEGEFIKKTVDQGVALRRHFTDDEAEKACGCLWRSCSIALKFM